MCCDENLASAEVRQRPIAPGCGIDNVGEDVCVLRSAYSQPGNLVDFAAVAERGCTCIKIVAQRIESASCRVAAPHPAGANQHLASALRIQTVGGVERSCVAPENAGARSREG